MEKQLVAVELASNTLKQVMLSLWTVPKYHTDCHALGTPVDQSDTSDFWSTTVQLLLEAMQAPHPSSVNAIYGDALAGNNHKLFDKLDILTNYFEFLMSG